MHANIMQRTLHFAARTIHMLEEQILNPIHGCRFSSKFSGVTVSDTVPSSAAILQISNVVNVAIVDSEMISIPGNINIQNSTVQIINGNFTSNSGGSAGALSIDSSRVLIDSSNFANNTGAAGGAIQVDLLASLSYCILQLMMLREVL